MREIDAGITVATTARILATVRQRRSAGTRGADALAGPRLVVVP